MTPTGRIPPGPSHDGDEWMAVFRSFPDEAIDALLAGEPSAVPADGITDLAVALRSAAARHGAPLMTAALRNQINGSLPARTPARRRLLIGAFGGLLFGGSAIGVAGAQDVLPAPLQDATASVAGVLGIDLPRTSERGGDADDHDDQGVPGDHGDTTEPGREGTDPEAPGTSPATGDDDGTTTPGPPATTPGGAVPADPGSPGDGEPATPATPPTRATGQGPGNGARPSEIGLANGEGTTKG